jgi:uracil phosphoribosyltransferase
MIGYSFEKHVLSPSSITIVPILRSGLSMVSAISALLPIPVPVHHLGMYREKTTLQPVEYYNNLPYHPSPVAVTPGSASGPAEVAIVVDPVIATGATACAAIETLMDWGVKKIIMISVIGSTQGLVAAANSFDDVDIFVGGCDSELDERGMIKPGLGDIGDRLFLTIGK